jgi:hypothetical protein
MAQTHTFVTLFTSRNLTWSSRQLTCQHASKISVVAHISWDVTYVPSALQTLLPVVSRNGGNAYWILRQRTFLHDTKSPDCRDQHMRANTWEEIGKELKIKRKTWRELSWCEDSVSPALGTPGHIQRRIFFFVSSGLLRLLLLLLLFYIKGSHIDFHRTSHDVSLIPKMMYR